jgi:hypothetical protein
VFYSAQILIGSLKTQAKELANYEMDLVALN